MIKSISFKKWFKITEDIKDKIKSMIDEKGYMLFFKKENDIFAADEDGRVVFAKIKNPDEDMPKNWEKEASFLADNLIKTIQGESGQHVFYKKDLENIDVMDDDKAIKIIEKKAKKLGDKALDSKKEFKFVDVRDLFHHDPDQASNFVQANED